MTDSAPSSFPSTRDEALRRLDAFTTRIAAYSATRNRVVPGHANVSRLSPAVRHRLVLEQELVEHAIRACGPRACEKFVQEVTWRTYWKGWLEHRPDVWRDHRRRARRLRADGDPTMLRRAQAVARGESGVAVMDAFAKELLETGFLHNHARMWWASFWIHVERLPWDLGADHFLRHLLDADPASNTLSWRWVAGLHTKGKHYLVRRSNIEDHLDPTLLGNGTGLERLEDDAVTPASIVDEADLARRVLPEHGVAPMPCGKRVGVWLHDDDLLAEVGGLATLDAVAIAGWIESDDASSLRQSHRERALRDGLDRAGSHWRRPVAGGTVVSSIAGAMEAWVAAEGLDEVIAHAPFVGPVHDAFDEIAAAARRAGASITLLRREWDAAMFPAAKAGFFPFWERARRLLS